MASDVCKAGDFMAIHSNGSTKGGRRFARKGRVETQANHSTSLDMSIYLDEKCL